MLHVSLHSIAVVLLFLVAAKALVIFYSSWSGLQSVATFSQPVEVSNTSITADQQHFPNHPKRKRPVAIHTAEKLRLAIALRDTLPHRETPSDYHTNKNSIPPTNDLDALVEFSSTPSPARFLQRIPAAMSVEEADFPRRLPFPHNTRPYVPLRGVRCPMSNNATPEDQTDLLHLPWRPWFRDAINNHGASSPAANGWVMNTAVALSLVRPLGMRTGIRVVDVGCGNGALLREVASYWSIQIIAIDPLYTLLKVAATTLSPGLFCQASAHNLSFIPTGSIDHVFCVGALNYLPFKFGLQAIQEIIRVLKPSGSAVFGMLNHIRSNHHASQSEFPAHLWIAIARRLSVRSPIIVNAEKAWPTYGRGRYHVYLFKSLL